ncbi:MAG: putative transport system permease protein [Acidobacteriota bacterium]|nr:putative transport system permease protein [Acidobacteriota bacterium]
MILRALVLRPIVREKIRTTLTVLGNAVGVAVVVAIQLANQSALRAFQESVDAIAGRANYQLVPDVAPLDESVLLRLQPLWNEGVRFAPVIDAEGQVEPSQMPIRLLAVDLFSDLHFRDYKYARIETRSGNAGVTQFLALFQPDAVVLPAPFAREHGLTLGSPITLNIHGIRRTLTVRGILEARGPATAFNGAIAVCDISVAQQSFGLTGKLSRVDLMVPEERATELLSRIPLPPGTRIERPSRRNERVERMLRAFRVNLFALAGVALLVGMFLVYNTVLISILRRRKDVGVLKTLGTSPQQIFGAFVGEGLLFGFLGSILGVALGYLLAAGILRAVGQTINTLYVATSPESVTVTPGVIALGFAVGMILSLLSALQPALEAARVPPSAMIRPGLQQRVAHRGALVIAALLCFAAGAAVSQIPPFHGIAVAGYIAVLLVVAGFSLLAPSVVLATSRLARVPLEKLFGIVGKLAAGTLPASLRRTSVASAALSLATGMMVAVALMVGSFRETVRIWVDQTVQSDLWLRPAKGLSNAPRAVFPPEIANDLRQMPFIAAFDRIRARQILYGDDLLTLTSGEFDVAAKGEGIHMVAPSSTKNALADAKRRGGVFVSEPFATKYGSQLGDVIRVPIPGGALDLPISGIYRDYSNDRGVIVMDRVQYVRAFHDETANTIVIYLRNGVDKNTARRELERRLGPKYNAFVVMNEEIRTEVMRIFDQTFLITYALLGVAIIVAVLGIVNTLAALILERTRELALLRISGLSLGELRNMIVLESSLLGIASTAAGLVMGYALSWILIYVINKQSFGWTIDFHTPTALIIASLAITFLTSTLAGLAPARLARRIDLLSAIKSE